MLKVLGTDLCKEDQRHVLGSFVHRYTGEHRPLWAAKQWDRATDRMVDSYPVQHATDADWLAHTFFHVRGDGRLDQRSRFCESTPTWPNNPELRKVTS